MNLSVKSSIKYSLAVAGWFILFLLGTELYMRLFVINIFPFDILKNGHVFEVWGVEGYGIVRYLPYAEERTPYDSGQYNVVVLGNSYTASKQVMDWLNYVSIAESDLRDQGISADLHNLGLNGLTLPSYIARSEFVLNQYHPDVLVIQVAPNEFFSDAFQPFNRGGYFAYDSNGALQLVPTTEPGLLLPEQIGEYASPPSDFLDYFSITAYLSYIARSQAEGGPATVTNSGNRGDVMQIATAELNILAKAYGDVPIVFVILPHSINTNRKSTHYEDSARTTMLINLISSMNPNWKVVYPIKEFNLLLKDGTAPMGFGNTKPFIGHMNINGQRALGHALAGALARMLK